jgi:cobalamin biosynthesis protein CobT
MLQFALKHAYNENQCPPILILQPQIYFFFRRGATKDPIEDLLMDDLVELFRNQVNLYGVARFVPLLAENAAISTGFNGPMVDENLDTDSDSVDVVSDSDSEDGDSEDDDFDSDIGENESEGFNEDESDDERFEDEAIRYHNEDDMLHVHEPPVFAGLHCPPYGSVEDTMHGVCDCSDFGMDTCAREDNFQFFLEKIDFEGEMTEATESVDFPDRLPSNKLRKRLYKKIFWVLDFGVLEKGERRRLPNCPVAKVRQLYPSLTGRYMGFKEN